MPSVRTHHHWSVVAFVEDVQRVATCDSQIFWLQSVRNCNLENSINQSRILDDGPAGPDLELVRALGRAHEWPAWIEGREVMSHRAIAEKAGVTSDFAAGVIPTK